MYGFEGKSLESKKEEIAFARAKVNIVAHGCAHRDRKFTFLIFNRAPIFFSAWKEVNTISYWTFRCLEP